MFAVQNSKLYVLQTDDDGYCKLFCGTINCDNGVINVTKLELCQITQEIQYNITSINVPIFGTGVNPDMAKATDLLHLSDDRGYHSFYNIQGLSIISNPDNYYFKKCSNIIYHMSENNTIADFALITDSECIFKLHKSTQVEIEPCMKILGDITDILVSENPNIYLFLSADNLILQHTDTNKTIETPFGVKNISYYNQYFIYLDYEGNLFKISLEGEKTFLADNVNMIARGNGTCLLFVTFNNKIYKFVDLDDAPILIRTLNHDIVDFYANDSYYCYVDNYGDLYISGFATAQCQKVFTTYPIIITNEPLKKSIKSSN